MKIEQKLSLYQIFLKLYEHNPRLLNEILQLENTGNQRLAQIKTQYVTGVVEQEQVYLITNLTNGKTVKLLDDRNIWEIGRGTKVSLHIPDRRLSRHHAVIEYRPNQGFYLTDLKSTNGTFLNQEPVVEPILLQDGDRVRLGSIVFCFFLCQETQQFKPLSPEFQTPVEKFKDPENSPLSPDLEPPDLERSTFDFFRETPSTEDNTAPLSSPLLTPERQAEILERFFEREKNRKQN